jgi:hypothetical protein
MRAVRAGFTNHLHHEVPGPHEAFDRVRAEGPKRLAPKCHFLVREGDQLRNTARRDHVVGRFWSREREHLDTLAA